MKPVISIALPSFPISLLSGLLLMVFISHARAQVCDPDETAKLLAGDGERDDLFGYAVSYSNGRALVGVSRDDNSNGDDAGAVYLYSIYLGNWVQVARFQAPGGDEGELFGNSVSIDGDSAVVGSYADDDNGILSGSVYIYSKIDGLWRWNSKLLASDGDPGDLFGASVSLSGDMAVIGAPRDSDQVFRAGSAYVYKFDNGVWLQQTKLVSKNPVEYNGFGAEVCIYDGTIALRVFGDQENSSGSGSVYVFVKDEDSWRLQAKLSPDGFDQVDGFGSSIAMCGDTLVIGAPQDDDHDLDAGSAYVFVRDGDSWSQQAKLFPEDGERDDWFGASVSIDGNTVVVGASKADFNIRTDAGAAYVFQRSDGVWTEQARLNHSSIFNGDYFGHSVAVEDNTVIIGAYGEDDRGSNSGAVYVFDLNCSVCTADLSCDGALDSVDIGLFLDAYNADDELADLNEDDEFDFLDIFEFVRSFVSGCS